MVQKLSQNGAKWSRDCPKTFKNITLNNFEGLQGSLRSKQKIVFRAPDRVCEEALSEIDFVSGREGLPERLTIDSLSIDYRLTIDWLSIGCHTLDRLCLPKSI